MYLLPKLKSDFYPPYRCVICILDHAHRVILIEVKSVKQDSAVNSRSQDVAISRSLRKTLDTR